MELKGKTAFITGAARGIGRAIACRFARAGANLVIVTDRDQAGLAATAQLVRDIGGQVSTASCDVTDLRQVAAAIRAAVEKFGGLDCAVNNAAFVPHPAELAAADEAQARRAMEVDYWGVFHCMRAEIPAMLERGGGTIVNIASGAGLFGFPGGSTYCAAKHALVGLTRGAALDYASRSIRINALCPGMIKTPALEAVLANEKAHAAAIALHPIGRLGEPEEIADAALWLSSPGSAFVVGACISVDGGLTAQ